MSLRPVTLELSEDSLNTLDEIAADIGADRQTVIRQALAAYFADYRELQAELVQADREIEGGQTIAHEDVLAWLNAQHPRAKDSEAA